MCRIIDFANSGDTNEIKKEAQKCLNYEHLITEVQHMWNVKTKAIPVKTHEDLATIVGIRVILMFLIRA